MMYTILDHTNGSVAYSGGGGGDFFYHIIMLLTEVRVILEPRTSNQKRKKKETSTVNSGQYVLPAMAPGSTPTMFRPTNCSLNLPL